MGQIYTKDELIIRLKELGIKKGMVVLVQAELSKFSKILGNEQCLIDALKELLTESGCIIVPTFSMSCLDPASYEFTDIPYQEWEKFRKCGYGFNKKITTSDVNGKFANQFLRSDDVIRTEHPVYSFALWGNFDDKCLEQTLNFPISFIYVLKDFISRPAVNLLIGVEKENALILTAIAKMMEKGVLENKRALIKKGAKNQMKNFLNLQMNQEEIEECLKMCYVFQDDKENVQILSLDTSLDSI